MAEQPGADAVREPVPSPGRPRRSGRPAGTSGPVAVDAMGGDRAPAEIVAGAIQAAEAGLEVVLVGDPDRLGDTGGLAVIPARETIEMHEDPGRAVRIKKDSSLIRAAEAVRDGAASAMVSAGNTGATMASALFRMGRIRGVARPAIATPIPVPGTTPTLLLDAGANAECSPAWLVQFAQMGSAFAKQRFGIADPRVGLLSIGEEPGKGQPPRQRDVSPFSRRGKPDQGCVSSATSKAGTSCRTLSTSSSPMASPATWS